MATWSDSKAVMQYQDFLASGKQEIELTPDGPSVIIVPKDGQNEISKALKEMGKGDDLVITIDETLPSEMGGKKEYPIYITLPPTELRDFLKNLRKDQEDREDDFVFFSGGPYYANIEDLLKDFGYCRDYMTQVLITGLGVSSGANNNNNTIIKDLSAKIGTDAMGEDKWAGECAACGKWNGAIAERLERNDVRCNVDFYRDWRRRMWERNVFDAVYNLVGAVREDVTTIADVANYYEAEVADMVWQVSSSLRGWKAVTLSYGFEERLIGVAENTGAETKCALDETIYPHIWGNRVFTDSALVNEYLWYAQENFGCLSSIELPPKREASGIFRKGNLRADGVI